MELARLAKVNIAEALSQSTGAAHDKFTTLHGLEKQLTAIGTELHNRYLLTLVPPEPQAEGYHRPSVSVRKLVIGAFTHVQATGQSQSKTSSPR